MPNTIFWLPSSRNCIVLLGQEYIKTKSKQFLGLPQLKQECSLYYSFVFNGLFFTSLAELPNIIKMYHLLINLLKCNRNHKKYLYKCKVRFECNHQLCWMYSIKRCLQFYRTNLRRHQQIESLWLFWIQVFLNTRWNLFIFIGRMFEYNLWIIFCSRYWREI